MVTVEIVLEFDDVDLSGEEGLVIEYAASIRQCVYKYLIDLINDDTLDYKIIVRSK